MADLTFIFRQFWLEIVEPINLNTHSLYRQLLIGTTWTKTLYPQRNSKVSGSRYIATKSLSTRHIIAQKGSYDVTLQIQRFWWYCIFVDGMTFAIHFPRIRMLRSITQAHSCLWHSPPWHCQFKYDKVFIHTFNTSNNNIVIHNFLGFFSARWVYITCLTSLYIDPFRSRLLYNIIHD